MKYKYLQILGGIALSSPSQATLQARYDFEETSGSTIIDKSGNGNNLDIVGSGTL